MSSTKELLLVELIVKITCADAALATQVPVGLGVCADSLGLDGCETVSAADLAFLLYLRSSM